MKKTTIALAIAAALLAACNNHPDSVNDTATADSLSIRDSLDRTRDKVRAEIEEYRIRLKNGIDKIQRDIDNAREQRKAEKNLKKQRDYDLAIERGENRRKTLQERLDRMGDNIAADWNNFKHELDDFFKETRNELRSDSVQSLKQQK